MELLSAVDLPSVGIGYVAGIITSLLVWLMQMIVSTEYRIFRQQQSDRSKAINKWYDETEELAVEARRAWSTYGASSNNEAAARLETISVKLDRKSKNAPSEIDEKLVKSTRETSRQCSQMSNWYEKDAALEVEPYLSHVRSAGRDLEDTADNLIIDIQEHREQFELASFLFHK